MHPHWKQPSHPDVIEVITQPGSFATYSKAKKAFAPGEVLGRLEAPTLTLAKRAYSSVQVGRIENIELNSDFLYINHSCEPNLEFHVLGSDGLTPNATETDHPIVIEVRAAANTNPGNSNGIQAGEELSFFYPSTEWDMNQPFECKCATKSCRGLIRGSRYLTRETMDEYFVNEHILILKDEQEKAEQSSSGGKWSGSLASGGSASPPSDQ